MNPLSTSELELMETHQLASLFDECVRLAYVPGEKDPYGKPIPAWTEAETLPCGWSATTRRKVMAGAQVVVTDGQLRLPAGTTISAQDRWRVTHRYGQALVSPPVYDSLGEPARGPSGILLDLRLVTDGTS